MASKVRFGRHSEAHAAGRIGWLRAAVLGANDGVVSTASLIVGVAAASASKQALLLTGVAALVAGAMSMAAGEYVSVSSQADGEAADLAKERAELEDLPEQELLELREIYIARGLEPALAAEVAVQLTRHDALAAHARDELGLSDLTAARPLQATVASGLSFAAGAALPLLAVAFSPVAAIPSVIPAVSLVALAALGAAGAKAGGATIWKPVARVVFWGALAMAVTALIGQAFGAVV